MEFDLKKEYSKYKKKYPKLPSFEDIDNEFGISLYDFKEEAINLFPRQLRRRVHEKMVYYCRVIEAAIYPTSSSPVVLYECNQISKEKKEQLAKLYKKIMDIERYNMELNIESIEEKEMDYIEKAYAKAMEFKPALKELASIMRKAWSNNTEEKEEGYYGWN